MLRTLDMYILRSFAVNYVISLASLIGMYITLHLFFNFDEFVEGQESLGHILGNMFSFYGYNLFLYFAQTSGVITLFAATATLARMQKANELIACLASGTSLYRVAVPVVVGGVLTNALWIIDQEIIIPRIAPKLARTADDVEGVRTQKLAFMRDRDNALLNASQYLPADQTMFNMVVQERDESGDMLGLIRAERAYWDKASGGWQLVRGVRTEPSRQMGNRLTEGDVPVRESTNFYPSDLTPADLQLRQASQWVNLLSLSQLAELEKKEYVNSRSVQRIRHSRFAAPFVNLLLLMLGLPFFLVREPSPILGQAAKCLLNCGLAFIGNFIALNLVGQDVSPALPAWVPIMIFAPLAVVYLDSIKT